MKANRIILAALAAFFVAAGAAHAQTNVIGTIVDPTGVPYNTGYIRFDLVPSGGPVPCVGTPCTSINGHYGNVYLDSNGHFQMNLWANGLITPASTQWQITVSEPGNPAPWCFGPQSFTTALTIPNQTTYDISSQLSALAPQLCRNGTSTSNIKIEHNGVLVGTEPAVNIVDTGSVVATVTDNPGSTRVDVSNASSGGTGCTIGTLLDQFVLFVHPGSPSAACDGSADWTWDDTNHNMQAGDGTNAITGGTVQFIQGTGNHHTDASQAWDNGVSDTITCDSNTLGTGCEDIFLSGVLHAISLTGASTTGSDLFAIGRGAHVTAASAGTVSDILCLQRGCSPGGVTVNTGGNADDSLYEGVNWSVSSTGASSNVSSIYGIGEGWSVTAGTGSNTQNLFLNGETGTALSGGAGSSLNGGVSSGFNNALSSLSGHALTFFYQTGDHDSITSTAGNLTKASQFGSTLSNTDCSHAYQVGENGTCSAKNNTLFLGMSAVPGMAITNSGGTHDTVTLAPLAFGSLPACAAGTEGSLTPVTDSTTATWGATITGGSTNHVLAYCDGTNWTVAAK